MSFLHGKTRLEQCYVYVAGWLNECNIRPDGAEIRPCVMEDVVARCAPPTTEEAEAVLFAMFQEGVQFESGPGAVAAFVEHPHLGKCQMRMKLKQ